MPIWYLLNYVELSYSEIKFTYSHMESYSSCFEITRSSSRFAKRIMGFEGHWSDCCHEMALTCIENSINTWYRFDTPTRMTLDQSVAEALDSVNWLSVQSPLKDVFLKFIESIEHQNTEIMRLDQEFKCFLLERDGNTRTLTSEVADCFSCLNTKADQRLLSAIESNYSKVRIKLMDCTSILPILDICDCTIFVNNAHYFNIPSDWWSDGRTKNGCAEAEWSNYEFKYSIEGNGGEDGEISRSKG